MWYNISMKKAIITVVSKDSVGILAKVCTYLAETGVNILDISQTVIQEYFNMIMIVDYGSATKPFDELSSGMTKLGTDMGMRIRVQKAEIFDKMHRV